MILERNEDIADKRIADMEENNAFWTETMRDESQEIKDRLKASELRARAAGGFVDKGYLWGAGPVGGCGDNARACGTG